LRHGQPPADDLLRVGGKRQLRRQLTAPADGSVTVSYTATPDRPDMAIFVMEGSCYTGNCIGSSLDEGERHDITFAVTQGVTYYIDLEAPSQQPSYTLTLTCS
jgi:hypothetical protein